MGDHIDHYRLDLAAKALYEFTWNEYCDWYLELSKPVLQGDTDPTAQAATRHTLVHVLENLLRCLHPLIPFITEEIWQKVAPIANASGATIMLQPWPAAAEFALDDAAEQELEWIREFILGVRQIRGEMDIAPGKPLPVLLQDLAPTDRHLLDVHGRYLQTLARLESIDILEADADAPPSATALLGGMKILVPMAGLIDVAAERQRLAKNRERAHGDLRRCEGKLANDNFLANAPEAVIAKERARAEALQQALAQLDEQLARLGQLE